MAGVSGSWGQGTARDEPVPGLLDVLAGTASATPVVMDALPGLAWAYSGGGYQIVAQVIGELTGLAFADAMAELVLGPAGMTASTFRQPLPDSMEPVAARGHHDREPVPGGWRNQPDLGAVGLWTTPSDLVRFARAVHADEAVCHSMLRGHPVEPRMGGGVFLTVGDRGVRWWSHTGLGCRWRRMSGACREWPAPTSPSTLRTTCASPSTASTSKPDARQNYPADRIGPCWPPALTVIPRPANSTAAGVVDQDIYSPERAHGFTHHRGSRRTISAPIPRLPPVTSATFPASRPVMSMASVQPRAGPDRRTRCLSFHTLRVWMRANSAGGLRMVARCGECCLAAGFVRAAVEVAGSAPAIVA